MGAGQSGGFEIGGSSMGYQVLRVYPNSPGSNAGLKAYFDFIVAIGNTRFNKEDGSLREILKASIDQKLKMVVFNTRNKQAREVEIVPTTSWGGSGLLGVSIKHSSFDKADERVWHVVEVDPGSPAQQAGLKADEDYVIGSDSILQESDDLYNLIEAHEGKALKLFVYNSKSDNCREVICHPNSRWGGRGFLGCEFGHGLLHRIPYADNQVVDGDSKAGNQQQLIHGSFRQPSIPQQQQMSSPQLPMQPGNQMFQQALFNQNPQPLVQQPNPASQQLSSILPPPPRSKDINQSQPKSAESTPALHRPQAPQTFAQLANAQSQARQEQQNHYQQQQQQQQQLQPQQQQQFHHQQHQGLADTKSNLAQSPAFQPLFTRIPGTNFYTTGDQSPASPSHPQTFVQLATSHSQSSSNESAQPPQTPQTFAQLGDAQSQVTQDQPQQQQPPSLVGQTQYQQQFFQQQQLHP